jgi:predicted phosphodiesterase
MKVGILGDIHANLEALNTCIKTLVKKEGCDYVMATGDVVGYGPQPKECIERLIELDIRSVRGNHDEYTLQNTPLFTINPMARFVIEWTREELDQVHIDFLQNLPDVLDAKDFSITHASNSRAPRWTYVLDQNTAKANFHTQQHHVCFNGHTHLPLVISEDPHGNIGMQKIENQTLLKEVKYLINAGSVGQPRDANPQTGCLTYDTESRELKALRMKYNYKKVQKLMRQKDFPPRLIQRLEEGR